MGRHVGDVERLEREAAGLETVVVAGDAVALDEHLAVDLAGGRRLTGRGSGDHGDETSRQRSEREMRNSRHLWPRAGSGGVSTSRWETDTRNGEKAA